MKPYNVYVTRKFEGKDGEGTEWIRVGVAFPHKSGGGFNLVLHANPINGELIMFPPKDDDNKKEPWE